MSRKLPVVNYLRVWMCSNLLIALKNKTICYSWCTKRQQFAGFRL